MNTDTAKWIIVCFSPIFTIPAGYLGYENSGATHIGGVIIGGICGIVVSFYFLAIIVPSAYFAFYKDKVETSGMIVTSPIGTTLLAGLFIYIGFYLHFLINISFWLLNFIFIVLMSNIIVVVVVDMIGY